MQPTHRAIRSAGAAAGSGGGPSALERLHANRWKAIALAQALATLAAVGLMARAQAPEDDWVVPDARVAAAAEDDEVASDIRLAAGAPDDEDKDWVASDRRLATPGDAEANDQATQRLASAADTLGLGDWLPRMAVRGDFAVQHALSPAASMPQFQAGSLAADAPAPAAGTSVAGMPAARMPAASMPATGKPASGEIASVLGFAEPEKADPTPAPSPFGAAAAVAATERLEETRGGFQLPGLNLSFGIERAVYVNGNLMATSVLTIDSLNRAIDASRVTVGSGMRVAGGSADILSSGPGSLVALLPQQIPNGALVLQNSLSDQRLQAQTMINATLEASPLLRATRFEALMRDSSLNALRR